MEILRAYPGLLIAIATVVGLLVGSFINVVAYRLPLMLQREWQQQCCELLELDPAGVVKEDATAGHKRFNLIKPDSHCPHCGAAIRPWQNIPLLSYLLLRGRCAHCRGAISPRYPVVEAASGILAALVAWRFGAGPEMLAALVLGWSLLSLTLIDLDHQILPDQITLPLLWLGLLLSVAGIRELSAADAVLGAAAGYLALWSVYWLFRLLTGKEGMGYGDFKLLAALGAWLGWQMLLLIVLLSSLVGAVVGIGMLLFLGRDRNVPIPFGPYLAGAGFITLLWGDAIITSYLQFTGIAT